jgi:hypothetical protein
LELLETENDLLLAQQGELEEEIQRLVKLLQDKDAHVCMIRLQPEQCWVGALLCSSWAVLDEKQLQRGMLGQF